MESATLTRPRPVAPAPEPAPDRRSTDRWAWIAFGLVCVGALVGFLAYPTYPNYDSYYSLLWGREMLDGDLPFYEAYRAPTPHPLATAVGAVLSVFGHHGERMWIAICVISFVALVAGVYRLARHAFTPLVGFVAGLLLISRFDFAFYAARGYLDISYMALVVWAAVLEARRPRAGTPVLVLLALAGLLRPEAWVMAGLYWLWLSWRASWQDRARYAALAAIGPVVWAGTDLIVTGDPLYSLTYTSSFAEELGRATGAQSIPSATWEYLVKLDKTPVVIGGILGVALAVLAMPRRAAVPAALLAVGLGTFGLVGAGGFSVIDRYLLVTSLMVMVFCAVSLAGWTMLVPGRLRTAWMAGAGLLVTFGIVWTAVHINTGRLTRELEWRGDAHAALHDVLKDPGVRAGLRCGPVSVPNHKLIPDVRWIEDLPAGRVVARSQALADTPRAKRVGARIARGGVAIYPVERFTILRQALVSKSDDPATLVPPPGYVRRAVSPYYAVYVRC
jgi:hypothetical protein